jgi:hypothetical protein
VSVQSEIVWAVDHRLIVVVQVVVVVAVFVVVSSHRCIDRRFVGCPCLERRG